MALTDKVFSVTVNSSDTSSITLACAFGSKIINFSIKSSATRLLPSSASTLPSKALFKF
jgi:hypothetical protein